MFLMIRRFLTSIQQLTLRAVTAVWRSNNARINTEGWSLYRRVDIPAALWLAELISVGEVWGTAVTLRSEALFKKQSWNVSGWDSEGRLDLVVAMLCRLTCIICCLCIRRLHGDGVATDCPCEGNQQDVHESCSWRLTVQIPLRSQRRLCDHKPSRTLQTLEAQVWFYRTWTPSLPPRGGKDFKYSCIRSFDTTSTGRWCSSLNVGKRRPFTYCHLLWAHTCPTCWDEPECLPRMHLGFRLRLLLFLTQFKWSPWKSDYTEPNLDSITTNQSNLCMTSATKPASKHKN